MQFSIKSWQSAAIIYSEKDNTMRWPPQRWGFRIGYNCADHIFVLRAITQLMRAQRKVFHCCFVDFRKAFDTVPKDQAVECPAADGVPPSLIRLIQDLYQHSTIQVQVADKVTPPFVSTLGVKQGCPLSPLLFCLYINPTRQNWNRHTVLTLSNCPEVR